MSDFLERSGLIQKAQRANETYSDALQALIQARYEFSTGSGKEFAGALKIQDELKAKIASSEQAIQEYESQFQEEFKNSGYERTEGVQAILRAKSEEAEILQELRDALADSESKNLDLDAKASSDADSLRRLYMDTYHAWARAEFFSFMTTHGEKIGRVMTLAKRIGTMPKVGPNGYRYYEVDPLERASSSDEEIERMRQSFIMEAFRECTKHYEEGNGVEFPSDMGTLDLGPFSDRSLMTPAEAFFKSKQRETLRQPA